MTENVFTSNSKNGIVTKVLVDYAYFITLQEAEKRVLKDFEEKKEKLHFCENQKVSIHKIID